MNIGEKIKKLRTEKVMTQSELAGNEITRNMLSQIENGSALPSLGTIRYIASRLNVSAGYLISDGEDEHIYVKRNEINGIKNSFSAGDYKICRDMCINAKSRDDDEIQLILAECNLKIAIEEFNNGALHVACSYFDEAIETCGSTVYYTDHIEAIAGMYFRYMNKLSSTLDSSALDIEEINVHPSLSDDFCVYAYMIYNSEELKKDQSLKRILQSDSPYARHLSAKEQMELNNFTEAYDILHKILYDEAKLPEPVLYFVLGDLELCCKETNDYKNAYSYSNEKLSLMQKLLS